jgi:hypothetical protein
VKTLPKPAKDQSLSSRTLRPRDLNFTSVLAVVSSLILASSFRSSATLNTYSLPAYKSYEDLPSLPEFQASVTPYTCSLPAYKSYKDLPSLLEFQTPDIRLTPVKSSEWSVEKLESSLFGSSREQTWTFGKVDVPIGTDSDAVLARNMAALGL